MFAVTQETEKEENKLAVNARTEEFQHIEVFDKPALFTNGRIARDTVPEGWYAMTFAALTMIPVRCATWKKMLWSTTQARC